ncbi:arginase family protein [Microbacterium hydrocarbonoxydans]|uniref:arginase family protein n=1 Tax=Microbacterium hydrocarbonoxydans TaxID=273678 RepID=UPI0007BB772E|nr:arginase family protein [Microbacterium hydrocarbonoxydans]GAT72744.1 arginase/agmatinase/formimionoglutamate hydrolase arginase family [Microbacterium sp. HM58-2]
MVRFLVVPQWQGSPAARAMLLVDGATAIAGDLPRAATTVLDVPVEAGESLGTGVRRLSSLLRTREEVAQHMTNDTVVIGGDCSVTVAALAALPGGTEDLAVVWFDAHPDMHTPETSPSGAFSGMALRAVLGEGEPQLALSPGIPRERVVAVGMRNLDDAEVAQLDDLSRLSVSDLDRAEALAEAVVATGAKRVWVHIDVDVLDPAELAGVSNPAPFGLAPAALSAAVRLLRERLPFAGATLAGFAPRSPADAVDDLGALLRLVGAVA